MQHSVDGASSLVVSYLVLRRAVGALGIALPVVLAIGALVIFQTGLRDSISDYYHTGMRNVFVGILCAIGVFLMSYRGYKIIDDRPGDPRGIFALAGVYAICVALFPTDGATGASAAVTTVGLLHLLFAALFFLNTAYVSLVLFIRTDPTQTLSEEKKRRILIYKICGWTILAAIALIGLHALLPTGIRLTLAPVRPVFWLESVAVGAFGISWLTKGKAISADRSR